MSAESIKFTVNGVEIEVPSVCMDYPLDRVNAENPYWTREALENVFKFINVNIPEMLGDVAQAVGDVINNVVGAASFPDGIWTGSGPGLPAAAEGGLDGPTVLGHVNNYGGIGGFLLPRTPVPAAPAGASLLVLQDLRVDPVGHLVINANGCATWDYAAKPFTCTTPVVYTPATDVVSHAAVGATTLREDTGKYLKGIRTANDGTGHVADPISPGDFGDLPTTHYHYASANAAYDTSNTDAPFVNCNISGGPAAQNVLLKFRGTYAKSIEYPNVRQNDILLVFQDAGGTWYCTGPHDAPINGPGCVKFTLIDVTDSGAIPLGWERVEINKASPPAFTAAFIKLVDTPADPPTLAGVTNGGHTHPLPNIGIEQNTGSGDWVNVCPGGGYTTSQEIDLQRIELAILRRVL